MKYRRLKTTESTSTPILRYYELADGEKALTNCFYEVVDNKATKVSGTADPTNIIGFSHGGDRLADGLILLDINTFVVYMGLLEEGDSEPNIGDVVNGYQKVIDTHYGPAKNADGFGLEVLDEPYYLFRTLREAGSSPTPPTPTEVWNITFSAGNHGTGTMSPDTVEKGEDYTLPENGFTPAAGFEFAGWEDAATSEPLGNPGDSIEVTSDLEIAASWAEVEPPTNLLSFPEYIELTPDTWTPMSPSSSGSATFVPKIDSTSASTIDDMVSTLGNTGEEPSDFDATLEQGSSTWNFSKALCDGNETLTLIDDYNDDEVTFQKAMTSADEFWTIGDSTTISLSVEDNPSSNADMTLVLTEDWTTEGDISTTLAEYTGSNVLLLQAENANCMYSVELDSVEDDPSTRTLTITDENDQSNVMIWHLTEQTDGEDTYWTIESIEKTGFANVTWEPSNE